MWPCQGFTWTLEIYILGSSCLQSCLCSLNYRILKVPISFDATDRGLKTSASEPLHTWKNWVSGNAIRMAAALVTAQTPASRSGVFSLPHSVTLWKLHTTCFDCVHPLSYLLQIHPHTHTHSTLCPLWSVFLTRQVQFVLPIRSWMCDLVLEHGQPTRDHSLNENWLLSQNLSSAIAPQLGMRLCSSPLSTLDVCLDWICTGFVCTVTTTVPSNMQLSFYAQKIVSQSPTPLPWPICSPWSMKHSFTLKTSYDTFEAGNGWLHSKCRVLDAEFMHLAPNYSGWVSIQPGSPTATAVPQSWAMALLRASGAVACWPWFPAATCKASLSDGEVERAVLWGLGIEEIEKLSLGPHKGHHLSSHGVLYFRQWELRYVQVVSCNYLWIN